jgi:hypothetical protein
MASDLDTLAALAEAATQGPWHVSDNDSQWVVDNYGVAVADVEESEASWTPSRDAAFIAAARAAVPDLIERVRQAEAENAVLRAKVAEGSRRARMLAETIESECDDDEVCHDHDRTDDGRCALLADVEAIGSALTTQPEPSPTDTTETVCCGDHDDEGGRPCDGCPEKTTPTEGA